MQGKEEKEDLRKLMLRLIKEVKDVKKQNEKIVDHQASIGEGFRQFVNSNVLLTAHVTKMAESISDFSEQLKKLNEALASNIKTLNESIENLRSVLTRPPEEEEEEDSYIV